MIKKRPIEVTLITLPNIIPQEKQTTFKTSKAYMKYSLSNDVIKLLVETIQNQFKAKKEESSTIQNRKEMFYYPLALAIFLFFIALFSLPNLPKRSKNQ